MTRNRQEAKGPYIKLCGLRTPQDIEAANAAQPDMAGFILSAGFRRSVTPRKALELIGSLQERIAVVGVFVNEPARTVASFTHCFDFNGYDAPRGILVQLHGDEDNAYISDLRHAMAYPGWWGIPIIKAFTIRTAEDVARANQSNADYLLLDNGQGTGETFDWSLIQNVKRPFMLAGGLGPHNVAAAIAAVHPWAVDMSSGVETNGAKDPSKMLAAVAAVRGAR